MRWRHLICATAPTSSVALRRQLPLIGEGIWCVQIQKTSPQKGADQQIGSAPSIYGSRSKVTSYKLDTPVSGGAQSDARRVSIVWNARLKHWCLPEFRCSMHQTVTKRPFSSPSFPARRKRRGRRRHVRNDHDGTSRRKRRLFSSVLVSSFPNRKLNLRFGFFYANLLQPLSLGCAEPAPLGGEPWDLMLPGRGW